MAAVECLLCAWFLLMLPLSLESNSLFTTTPGIHTTSGEGQSLSLQWEFGGVGSITEVFMLHDDMCVIRKRFNTKFDCSDNPLDTSVRDIEVAGRNINHIIHSVDREDAGYYTCLIRLGAANYTDSNAVVYVFDKPDTAKITPSGSVHEGSNFILRCHAVSTSLPAANRSQVNMVYTWRNNSEDLDPGDLPERYSITSSGDPANAVNDLLVITSLSRHDAGSYTCNGHENGSTLLSDVSNSYMLIPLYAPGLALSRGNRTVDTDDDVTLSCSADERGRPDGDWIWTTPGGPDVNTSDVGQLTVTEATVMRDDGVYSCLLNNLVGNGIPSYAFVTVREMPSMEVIVDVSLKNTEPLNVSCKAKARPQSDITWKYANGSSLPSSVLTWTISASIDGKYGVTTSYLQWTADSSPDERRHKGGGITCVTSNVVGETTTDFMLDVQFTPYSVQVKPNATIIEYDSLEPVLCSAVCNPPCSYSWYKEGAWESSNAELVIHNVTRDDHGTFECRPDNGIHGGQTADFDLTVFYGPSVVSFKVISPISPINQSDDVMFSCETDSRPSPVITLIRPSGDMLVSSSTNNTLEHTLTDIDCLDSGAYRCEANNSRTGRKDQQVVQVIVQCLPRKHSTSDARVGAIEGDTVTFSIIAIAYPPPTFMWFFKGNVLPDHSYVAPSSYSQGFVPEVYVNSTLTLSNVTHGDFGNYSVTASNALGDMEHVVYSLTAAGPPVAPSQLVASHSNAVSIAMQWISGWNRGGEQVFSLLYRRSDSDDSFTNITDINDPGQAETVIAKAVGLLSDTSYDFMVLATNQFGYTQTLMTPVSSEAEPHLDVDGSLSVTISDNTAIIGWSLHDYIGPITHVEVNSCDVISTKCFITTVVNITGAVEVTVPEGGSSYSFVFRVYDGDDLLLNVNHATNIDTRPSTGLVVGVVVAVVLLCAASAVIGVLIWRKRGVNGEGKTQDYSRKEVHSNTDRSYENTSPRQWATNFSGNMPAQQDISPYEQIEDSTDMIFTAPGVYERPQAPQSLVVPTVYETLRPDNTVPTEATRQRQILELSEYTNMN